MIEFKNVYKKYDTGTEALKNINLRIERGEFVFIVGASGSGKSTFLKTIMREEVPTSGTIMINNYDLTRMTDKEIPYFRRTMGIVFQDFRLIPSMSVYDNVAFAMRVIGANEKEIRQRVPYVLSLVGLQNKARSMPSQISGGEQQRVALARALVNNANTIIADEPTGNIDPEMSYEIVDLLNHINENGTTVIMVTHEHELVKKFNHRIVVIDHGSVISDTAAGANLSYDETTGYKVETTENTQAFAENSDVVTVEMPEEYTEEIKPEDAYITDTEVEKEAQATYEPDPNEYIEEDPIAAAIGAKVAAAVAGPNESLYMEQLAALENAAKSHPEEAAVVAQYMTPPAEDVSTEQKTTFADLAAADYSKYFEEGDAE